MTAASILSLSAEAEYLTRLLYRQYLDSRESGMGKGEAYSIGDADYIYKLMCRSGVLLSLAGVGKAVGELYKNNLISKDHWGYVTLHGGFVDFCMRNHVKV